jgi:hypothetical protein
VACKRACSDDSDEGRRLTKEPAAAAWAAAAEALARWALANLVNRTDAYALAQLLVGRPVVVRTPNLTSSRVIRHFRGREPRDLIGLHATALDNTCRWVALTIGGDIAAAHDQRQTNRKAAIKLHTRLRELGFAPLLFSRDGHGQYDLLVLFDQPVPAATAYAFAGWLGQDWSDLGLAEPPRIAPGQPGLGDKVRYGSWLPLPGRHPTREYYSRVWADGRWASGADAVNAVLNGTASDPQLIPDAARSYRVPHGTEELASPVEKPAGTPPQPGRRVRSLHSTRPIDDFLSRLKNVNPCGSGWSARCPAHNDHHNSLSVAEGDDGRVLVFCHAGCLVEEVLDALELSMGALFDRRSRRRPVRYGRKEER